MGKESDEQPRPIKLPSFNTFANVGRMVRETFATTMWYYQGHRPWEEHVDWDMLVAPRLTTLIRRYDLDAHADEAGYRLRAAWFALRGEDPCS